MSTELVRRSQPPGPRGGILQGSTMTFHRTPLEFMVQNAREYGDIARFHFFHIPAYQVNHPDDVRILLVDPDGHFHKGMALEGFRPLVGKGLLLNEGESHRRQRRMMQPPFHRARIAGYGEQMLTEARQVCARWQDGQAVDISVEMNGLTLAVAASTLFGANVSEAETRDVAEAMRGFAEWYHQSTHPMGPLLQLLPTRATRRFREGKRRLDAVVARMIEARRTGGDRGDILSMLVFARDEEGNGAAMSNEHIHDEAVGLLVAGHETTGGTLTWAWWLLAQHPAVAEKLREEVRRAVGDRQPEVSDLPQLKYAEGVFAETLRLYPSAMALVRQAKSPVEMAGYTIPAGAVVMASAWCTHRDPRFWEEPEAFRPERWTPEARAARPRFAYYPFGGGSRVCLGEAFAWMEGTLVLATLAQRWQAIPQPGYQAIPETLFTLRPKGGLPMTLRRVG